MADRPDSDREVLTSLPRTRPVRRSAKREEHPRTAATATKPTSKPAAADRTPRATAQPKQPARPGSRPAAGVGDRTTAQRSGSAPRRKVPPAGYASPVRVEEEQRSPAADLLGTAVQAASELAQIGFAVGRQALQSMLDRLPKP